MSGINNPPFCAPAGTGGLLPVLSLTGGGGLLAPPMTVPNPTPVLAGGGGLRAATLTVANPTVTLTSL